LKIASQSPSRKFALDLKYAPQNVITSGKMVNTIVAITSISAYRMPRMPRMTSARKKSWRSSKGKRIGVSGGG
jgi:hypothetical protein